jgi:serine/threonine protein kinase/tetratricopeptide (TPR) repeat protein
MCGMIGSRFGQFEITAKLGEGGMGVVYEAFDHELGRKVAVKVLPVETARDTHRLERFRREARAVAALNHPNIVTIHGIESAGDKHFLVMELVEGQSLDRLIGDEGMPVAQTFDIAVAIADALGAAHAKGVVHRDIKPSNVMVTSDGQIKVLDFGLAKAVSEPASPGDDDAQAPTRTTPLTGEGIIVGTAPYMSPEQLQGHDVDQRSDIFSLGVVLFEMVTGIRPFGGDSRIAVASSILKDTPASVNERRTDLPRHLGRIIRQCLEKDPDRRFQTARDVRNQLADLRTEIASGEKRAPETDPRRPRWVPIVLGLVVIVTAIAAWRTLAPPGPSPSETTHRIVVLPFDNQGRPDDEYFADGMTEEITSRLGAVQGIAVISRASAMRYKDERPSLREIGAELGVDYVLDGTVRWQQTEDGGSNVRVTPELIRIAEDTQVWSHSYNAVLADIFSVQSDIALQVSEALGATLLEHARADDRSRSTDNLEAYDAFLRANEYFNRGIEIGNHAAEILVSTRLYDKALELDPGFALAHARRAIADEILYSGYADHTPERLARIRESALRALELEPDLPEAHHARGLLYITADKDDRRAIEEFQVALSLGGSAEVYLSMSDAQQNLGLWDEVEATLDTAMELHPHAGEYACSAGGIRIYQRRFREALELHDRALQLIPDRWCPYYCKANIYLNWDGDTIKTREFLESVPADIPLSDNPPINHPWVWVEMFEGNFDAALQRLESSQGEGYEFAYFYTPKDLIVARIHRLTGSPELAREHYDAARALLERKLEEDPEDVRLPAPLGVALAGLGRRTGALAQEIQVLRNHEARPGRAVGYDFRALAELHLLLGQEDKAVSYVERMLSSPSFFAAPAVKIDPTWRDLQDHPAFIAMLEKYGG